MTLREAIAYLGMPKATVWWLAYREGWVMGREPKGKRGGRAALRLDRAKIEAFAAERVR